MSKNYLTYPCKVMRITQNYNGTTSHKPHTLGTPKDYPWDEGGKDTGRDWLYCPCDEMKVMRIFGAGTNGTNTIWLESTTIVYFADGTSGYLVILITHPNDEDLKKLKVGQVFTRGDKICREGADGATANHLHLSVGKGRFRGNGWVKNSKGKWVLDCTGGACKPEQLIYVDPSFTTIKSSGSLTFKTLPKTSNFFPARGYFMRGDVSANVSKIASFMFRVFPAYTSEKALGNIYGENLIKAVTEFQRRNNLIADGYFGPLTLAKLKEAGFKE